MNQFHGKYLKKIREIELFDFTSFFGLDFFKFSGPLENINFFGKLFISFDTGGAVLKKTLI